MGKINESISIPWNCKHIMVQPVQKEYRSKKHEKERGGLRQGGMIYHVGVGYVELLQQDLSIIKVLTDKIAKIIWVDQTCTQTCFEGLPLDCKCRDKHHQNCSDCHPHHHKDWPCNHKVNSIHEHVLPLCDDRIYLRLAGLTDSINFKLFRHKGCKVVLELS